MENNNEEINIIQKLKDSGIDFLKLPEYIKQIKQFLPMVKSFFPMIKEAEKTFNIKENQTLIYSCKVEKEELFIYGFVIEQKDKQVVITEQKFKLTSTELIEKITSFIPM